MSAQELAEKLQRFELQVRPPVAGMAQLVREPAVGHLREALEREGRPRAVATQALDGFAIVGVQVSRGMQRMAEVERREALLLRRLVAEREHRLHRGGVVARLRVAGVQAVRGADGGRARGGGPGSSAARRARRRAADGVQPMTERELREIAHAGKWQQQRSLWREFTATW